MTINLHGLSSFPVVLDELYFGQSLLKYKDSLLPSPRFAGLFTLCKVLMQVHSNCKSQIQKPYFIFVWFCFTLVILMVDHLTPFLCEPLSFPNGTVLFNRTQL